MKKLATLVFALLIAGSLSFAQAGGSTPGGTAPAKTEEGKKAKSGKKHKGGKKGKKGEKAETTAAPDKK